MSGSSYPSRPAVQIARASMNTQETPDQNRLVNRNGHDHENQGNAELDSDHSDDAASIVAVSLGPAQTHLASSKTPATVKRNALETVLDGSAEDQDFVDGDSAPTSPERAAAATLPQPKAKPRLFDTVKHVAQKSPFFHSTTSLKDAADTSTTAPWTTAFLSSLSSLSNIPKNFHLPTSGRATRQKAVSTSQSVSSQPNPRPVPSTQHDLLTPDAYAPINGPPCRVDTRCHRSMSLAEPIERQAPLLRLTPVSSARSLNLRRSLSANSLPAHMVLSPVSSLGDDTRFDNVQAQVNSRLRAIRDGWQDSNIRLPTIRGLPSIASLSLESFRPDFAFSKHFGQRQSTPPRTLTDPERAIPSMTNVNTSPPNVKPTPVPPQEPFKKACADLTGDLVILGGYRGSILRSSEPPNRQVWVPLKVGLNVRKVDLTVGLEADADEKMPAKIIPSGMLTNVGPVSISKKLFTRLHACENALDGRLRVHNYGYDWRLDPHLLSRQLIAYLEALPCNQPDTPARQRGATVIAHSLGGLITRHIINKRPELVAGVVYAGTPTTCVNILGPLRNGDDVLLSSRVLTAQVNFTIRTSYTLLPLDGKAFFNPETKEAFPIDFFNPATWEEYRLSPCVARALPALPVSMPDTKSMVSALAAKLPRRNSLPFAGATFIGRPRTNTVGGASRARADSSAKTSVGDDQLESAGGDMQMDDSSSSSVATAVTISYADAMEYLTRTLANVKRFKQELAHRPDFEAANRYPPAAVMYGKSTPTVHGAKVKDRDAIKRANAYDNLAFASGDGVVLARAAMLPEGYRLIPGGRVSSHRGHVTLLGDLNGVGQALNAVMAARRHGVGTGGLDDCSQK